MPSCTCFPPSAPPPPVRAITWAGRPAPAPRPRSLPPGTQHTRPHCSQGGRGSGSPAVGQVQARSGQAWLRRREASSASPGNPLLTCSGAGHCLTTCPDPLAKTRPRQQPQGRLEGGPVGKSEPWEMSQEVPKPTAGHQQTGLRKAVLEVGGHSARQEGKGGVSEAVTGSVSILGVLAALLGNLANSNHSCLA